jgi:hypothetical protein
MSKTVIILGAGASVSSGAPLMKNFLDKAELLRDAGAVQESKQEFDLVFKALAALNRSHTKATLDVINIESVFAAFEMAKLLGKLGDLTAEEIGRLPNAMRRVIVRTLEETINIPLIERQVRPPGDYPGLSSLFEQLGRRPGELNTRVSVVTFNYDLCADMAIHRAGFGVRYCLDDQKSAREIPLLKLHGSLNWGRCSECKRLVAWSLDQYFRNRMWPDRNGVVRLVMSAKTGEFQHCRNATFDAPFVVPPTWNKSQYHAELELVWQAAARELAGAENIVVCGYSLPESDEFFRYLYALGTVSDLRLKEFCVFDPNEKVGSRFRQLLGQAVIERFRFSPRHFDSNTFNAIAHLFR